MRILVVSRTCSPRKYDEIFNRRFKPMLDTNQKFILSLIEGLSAQDNITVDCVTSLPISHSCYPEKIIKSEEETCGDIFYHYCDCINYPVIRTLTVKHSIKVFVKKYIKKHRSEKITVLCDGLIAEANSITGYLRKKGIPSVALVTDIPNIVTGLSSVKSVKSLLLKKYGKYATKLLQSFDRYVFLTRQMNEICNSNNKPYMIMECIVTPVDIDIIPSEKLSDKPVVLYAGKLHSDFGVLELAGAAEYLRDFCEIWLYGGHGNCGDELKMLAERNPNLKIHGIVKLSEIYKLEKNAQILINPRPNEKDFTKYSFPSKTAEYMMMQIPVVMYKLDGIPDEYDEYLYYIKDKTSESIADKIRLVLCEDESKRLQKAETARKFIVENKNNLIQAKRLVNFIDNL